MFPNAIKHKFQESTRQLLHTATSDDLRRLKTRANTTYDINPKSHRRFLKIQGGILPNKNSTPTMFTVKKAQPPKIS
jgi:hypothetical protein